MLSRPAVPPKTQKFDSPSTQAVRALSNLDAPKLFLERASFRYDFPVFAYDYSRGDIPAAYAAAAALTPSFDRRRDHARYLRIQPPQKACSYGPRKLASHFQDNRLAPQPARVIVLGGALAGRGSPKASKSSTQGPIAIEAASGLVGYRQNSNSPLRATRVPVTPNMHQATEIKIARWA